MKKFFWYFMEYFLLILLLVLLNFKLPNQNLWLVIITYLIVFSITTILFKICIILKGLKNYLKLISLVILSIIYIPFYYNKHIKHEIILPDYKLYDCNSVRNQLNNYFEKIGYMWR